MLIAVVIPPGMAAWLFGFEWIGGWIRQLIGHMFFWGWPHWIGFSIAGAVFVLWFALPWVGVVWLMLKIWKRKPPRITEGKG